MKCKNCDGYGGDPYGGLMCDVCKGAGVINSKEPLTHCPMCKDKIDYYAECRTDKPFTAYDPMEGLLAWGAYDLPKLTACYIGGEYIHFKTPGDERPEERLVLMTNASGNAQ